MKVFLLFLYQSSQFSLLSNNSETFEDPYPPYLSFSSQSNFHLLLCLAQYNFPIIFNYQPSTDGRPPHKPTGQRRHDILQLSLKIIIKRILDEQAPTSHALRPLHLLPQPAQSPLHPHKRPHLQTRQNDSPTRPDQ